MGWESTLSVGMEMIGLWYGYAPPAPSLLFRLEDFKVEGDDDESPNHVFSTTVANALANLEANGFSWNLLLHDYSEAREYSLELAGLIGFLTGMASSKQGNTASEVSALFDAVRSVPAEEDLRVLAARIYQELVTLRDSWSMVGDANPITPFRDAVLFPGSVDLARVCVGTDYFSPTVEDLVLIRARDYFQRNHSVAPLIGWYFAILVVLRHSPSEAVVEFDLSGDPGFEEQDDPHEHAEGFWIGARRDLGETARFYGGIFANLAVGTSDFASAAQFGRLEQVLASTLAERDPQRMGNLLEALVAGIVQIPHSHLAILEKRLKHADEELDLVLRNDLPDSFWANFNSPIIIVECKNWQRRVDIGELRVLETKIDDRGSMCRIGVFVSLRGFSRPFLERARALQAKSITVFPVDGEDLAVILRGQMTLPNWLKQEGLRKLL